jgi:hypothetical protein
MRRGLLLVLLVSPSSACDKIPGTQAYKQRTSVEGAEAAAAYNLIDPSSAQFRNVRVIRDLACGEVNGKNRMAAYAGFTRFIATRDKDKWTAELDPQFDEDRFKQVQQQCQSGVAVEISCREAIEMTVQSMPQTSFDFSWKDFCESK